MSDIISKLLDDLNPEQKDVVESQENLYVTACPGSGKTRVLTRKIAYQTLKFSDSLKKNIAITYTNRAADEIKERLNLLNVDNETIWVGTIHQFCLEFILYPFKMNLSRISKGFTIIDDYTQREYLNQINASLNLNLKSYEINKIDLSLSSDFETNEIKYSPIAKMYHEMLERNKEIDFDMILLLAYKILSINNNVSTNIANNIRAIYVDEFQDTRELQYNIIGKLTKNNQKIQSMFVGDIDQAIYGSLDGIAKPVNDLEKITMQTFSVKTLYGCYRSTQRLVNFYSNFQGNPYYIESRGNNKDEDGFINYNCEVIKDNLPSIIKNKLKKCLNEGVSENDICIISPQYYPLFPLAEYLKKELPNCNFDAISISPIKVNDHSIFFKLSILYFTKSGEKVYRRKTLAKEILNILINEFGIEIDEYYIDLDLLKVINSSKKMCTSKNGVELYEFITKRLFIEFNITEKNYPSVLKQYTFFVDEMKERIKNNSLSNDIASFERMFKSRKGITITTAHKVKGNEYDTVIAINLLNGKIPHWDEIINSPDKGENSARKLLYVICSRAKNNLFLFSEVGYTTKKGRPLLPSDLLKNIEFSYDF